ncbi:MAG: CcmD family protein [Bacteroidota bacterium]
MSRIIQWTLLIFTMMSGNQSFAQDVEMADGFRGDGKIYVVVAVVLLILIGLFAYLVFLDRRLKKLESERNGGEE